MARGSDFDPREILAALERHYVDYVLIGGLARVLRGTGELTRGVDICPSFSATSIRRLGEALDELHARDGRTVPKLDEQLLARRPLLALSTGAGPLNIVGAPAGAPNGFVDLRRGATKEDLGYALRPLVASTPDLARMAAALSRDEDLPRLRQLRRIIELEANRTPPPASQTRAPQANPPSASRARRTRR